MEILKHLKEIGGAKSLVVGADIFPFSTLAPN